MSAQGNEALNKLNKWSNETAPPTQSTILSKCFDKYQHKIAYESECVSLSWIDPHVATKYLLKTVKLLAIDAEENGQIQERLFWLALQEQEGLMILSKQVGSVLPLVDMATYSMPARSCSLLRQPYVSCVDFLFAVPSCQSLEEHLSSRREGADDLRPLAELASLWVTLEGLHLPVGVLASHNFFVRTTAAHRMETDNERPLAPADNPPCSLLCIGLGLVERLPVHELRLRQAEEKERANCAIQLQLQNSQQLRLWLLQMIIEFPLEKAETILKSLKLDMNIQQLKQKLEEENVPKRSDTHRDLVQKAELLQVISHNPSKDARLTMRHDAEALTKLHAAMGKFKVDEDAFQHALFYSPRHSAQTPHALKMQKAQTRKTRIWSFRCFAFAILLAALIASVTALGVIYHDYLAQSRQIAGWEGTTRENYRKVNTVVDTLRRQLTMAVTGGKRRLDDDIDSQALELSKGLDNVGMMVLELQARYNDTLSELKEAQVELKQFDNVPKLKATILYLNNLSNTLKKCCKENLSPMLDVLFESSDPTKLPQSKYKDLNLESVTDVVLTKDGGYFITGTRFESGSTRNLDAVVLKLNLNATLEWEKAFEKAGSERLFSAAQTTEGGYIVCGNMLPGYYIYQDDLWVQSLDSKGNSMGRYTYPYSIDGAHAILQASDGNFVAVGAISNSTNALNNSVWVAKLNKAQQIIWELPSAYLPSGHYQSLCLSLNQFVYAFPFARSSESSVYELELDALEEYHLDLRVSSLRRDHANLLCIVPIFTDDLLRGSLLLLTNMQ